MSYPSSQIQPEINEDTMKTALKSETTPKKFSVPETIAESFEWVTTGGKVKTYELPVVLLTQVICALSLIFIPNFALFLKGAPASAQDLIFDPASMGLPIDHLDIVRACNVVGYGWLTAVFTLAALHFVAKLIKMSRRNDQSLSKSAQKTLEMLKFLRFYISISVGFLSAMVLVKSYYPQSLDIAAIFAQTEAEAAKDAKDDDNMYQVFVLISMVLETLFTFGKKSTTDFFRFKNLFPIAVNTFGILFLVLLFEKLILHLIASNYRTATTAGRFADNAYALSILKQLFRAKIENAAELKLGKSFDSDLTASLFDSLTGSESGEAGVAKITVQHLESIMPSDQAKKLFGILDLAQNGDMTKDEFIEAVKSVYDEKETLVQLVSDHNDIISKLDDMMLWVIYSITGAVALTFLGVPGVEIFKTGLGLLVTMALFFSDAIKKVFDSLVFVLVTHPYDLGDRVEIDGKFLYVETVGMWTTVFNGPGGLKTIMTNASLADHKIANFRRSPAENELFSYLVRPETVTAEAVESLRQDCINFFNENSRDFLSNWHLETTDQIDNERFKIFVKVYHRHNFQNEEAKNIRSQKFALFFKDALVRNGFVFSPALPKAIAANL